MSFKACGEIYFKIINEASFVNWEVREWTARMNISTVSLPLPLFIHILHLIGLLASCLFPVAERLMNCSLLFFYPPKCLWGSVYPRMHFISESVYSPLKLWFLHLYLEGKYSDILHWTLCLIGITKTNFPYQLTTLPAHQILLFSHSPTPHGPFGHLCEMQQASNNLSIPLNIRHTHHLCLMSLLTEAGWGSGDGENGCLQPPIILVIMFYSPWQCTGIRLLYLNRLLQIFWKTWRNDFLRQADGDVRGLIQIETSSSPQKERQLHRPNVVKVAELYPVCFCRTSFPAIRYSHEISNCHG